MQIKLLTKDSAVLLEFFLHKIKLFVLDLIKCDKNRNYVFYSHLKFWK